MESEAWRRDADVERMKKPESKRKRKSWYSVLLKKRKARSLCLRLFPFWYRVDARTKRKERVVVYYDVIV